MCCTVFGFGSVLGRPFLRSNPATVVGLDQTFEPEFRARGHDGQCTITQKIGVESIEIVFPQMVGIPGISYDIVLGIVGISENIVLCEACPSFGLVGAACIFLPLRLHQSHIVDIVEEWHVQFAEICVLGGPVVHLHVYVGMDVAIPCRFYAVVPYTLQVRGTVDAARTADKQVTTECII